jgi:uncharacterized membrane protein SpoIIM required for sporulation
MSQALQIKSTRFRAQREADWNALEVLVRKAEAGGPAGLSLEEAQSLSRLYRKAAASLATAREVSLDQSLLLYLESLVERAFLAVYAPQETLSGVVSRFFTRSAPRAMRNSGLALLLSTLAMTLGGLIAWMLYFQDTSWFHTFVPAGLAAGRGPGASTESLREVLFDGGEGLVAMLAAFAAYLISNNTRVAMFCFALGVFACLPGFLLLLFNGLIIGAFAALYADRGLGYELFGWLSVHGVTELAAIIIAGAGGFRMGFAVLFPGAMTRRDAVRVAGRDATKLALIAIVMLLVAGLLEGFGRQLITSTEIRLAVGWGFGLIWLSWFMLAGRRSA